MAVARFAPQFTKGDVQKLVLKRMAQLEVVVLSRLRQVGESFIADARSNGSYTDQTGNLRSSIGYVIMKDGVQIENNFPGSGEGAGKGSELADRIGAEYPVGYVLIVVAGMEYAAAVEAKGYDVLTMSSLKAESSLKKALQRIAQKA